MNFIEAIKNVFRNYANFKGRARRSEYWYFVLFQTIIIGGFCILLRATYYEVYNSGISDYDISGSFKVIFGLFLFYLLATIIPNLAVHWRRFHDIGKSGVFALLFNLPLTWILFFPIFLIPQVIWLTRDSQTGTNQYGPNPKEI